MEFTEILKKLELGAKVVPVEEVEVDRGWFINF
jgi:hypothetical protein